MFILLLLFCHQSDDFVNIGVAAHVVVRMRPQMVWDVERVPARAGGRRRVRVQVDGGAGRVAEDVDLRACG